MKVSRINGEWVAKSEHTGEAISVRTFSEALAIVAESFEDYLAVRPEKGVAA